EFDIEYGVGISKEGCLIDLGIEHDLVQKSGSFFSYGELRLGQGRNNSKEFLRDNPETALELEKKIYAKIEAEAPAGPEPRVRAVAAVADPPAEKEEPKQPEDKPKAAPKAEVPKAEAPKAETKPKPKQAAKKAA